MKLRARELEEPDGLDLDALAREGARRLERSRRWGSSPRWRDDPRSRHRATGSHRAGEGRRTSWPLGTSVATNARSPGAIDHCSRARWRSGRKLPLNGHNRPQLRRRAARRAYSTIDSDHPREARLHLSLEPRRQRLERRREPRPCPCPAAPLPVAPPFLATAPTSLATRAPFPHGPSPARCPIPDTRSRNRTVEAAPRVDAPAR